VRHLIADNQGKLDMPEYGKKIEEYLSAKGESVQKMTINSDDLEDNYLVDIDGEISLFPKIGGQVKNMILFFHYESVLFTYFSIL